MIQYKYGINGGKNMALTTHQKEMIATLRTKNYGYAVIATKMGIERDQVRDYCRRNGLTGYKGEGNKPEKPLFCKHCGKEFRLSKLGELEKSKTYCSKECSIGFWETERTKNAVGKKAYCVDCGKEYKIKHDWASPLFCSEKCRMETKRKNKYAVKPVFVKICERCGEEYATTREGQRYCSPACDVITTTCKECGKEFQHKRYHGARVYCSLKCQTTFQKLEFKKTHEEYCEQFTKIHKWKIVPITQYNGMSNPITVKCFECGKETTRKAEAFVEQTKRRGCRYCCKQLSTTENVIEDFLIEHRVGYIRQYQCDDLTDKGKMRYDFAILNDDGEISKLLEYNGSQHYEPVGFFGGADTLIEQQRRDVIKREHAKKIGVPLIEITYKQRANLTDILGAILL